MSLLQVEDLAVSYGLETGRVRAVDGVTFSLDPGEALGVVGESGCGKTTLAKSIMRLLPDHSRIDRGQMVYAGSMDLARLSPKEMREVRWKEIAMVPQSAMNALNPVHRVGDQLCETMTVRTGISRKQAWRHGQDLFEKVGIDPDRLGHYPHQFSGGMKQRATIALALALDPKLIIADEPTTALDVLVEVRILSLLKRLQRELDLSFIYITHDLGVVARTCDRVAVIYAGKLVEVGPTREVLARPRHPYTMGLVSGIPTGEIEDWEPVSIPGAPPDLKNPPDGCRFAGRCPFAVAECSIAPPLAESSPRHFSACHFHDDAEVLWRRARRRETWEGVSEGAVT